jgi:actin related protein 2/3 complex, subunit 4
VEDKVSKELCLTPLTITRSEKEAVYIEPSINSVRISIKIKQNDEMERILVKKMTSFLMKRAEQFIILRRKPISSEYDLSLLITSSHMESMVKQKVIDFTIHFIETIDAEISSLRLSVNSRSRAIAGAFLEGLAGRGL